MVVQESCSRYDGNYKLSMNGQAGGSLTMMHRMLRFPSNWEWHVLHEERPNTANLSRRSHKQASPSSVTQMETTNDNAEVIHTIKQSNPEMAGWLGEIRAPNRIILPYLSCRAESRFFKGR